MSARSVPIVTRRGRAANLGRRSKDGSQCVFCRAASATLTTVLVSVALTRPEMSDARPDPTAAPASCLLVVPPSRRPALPEPHLLHYGARLGAIDAAGFDGVVPCSCVVATW